MENINGQQKIKNISKFCRIRSKKKLENKIWYLSGREVELCLALEGKYKQHNTIDFWIFPHIFPPLLKLFYF